MIDSKILEKFEIVLLDAEERGDRSDWVHDPITGHEGLEWVLYERERMFELVNEIREQQNLPAVTQEELFQKCEQQAVGHSDYVRKFALYCTELAMGIR